MILIAVAGLVVLPRSLICQWVQSFHPDYIHFVECFYDSGPKLFAGTSTGGSTSPLLVSNDPGGTWTIQNGGVASQALCAVVGDGENLYAALGYGTPINPSHSSTGIARSTDEGYSWTRVGLGLTDTLVSSLAVLGHIVFAGTVGGDGIFRSTDSGRNWSPVNQGLKGSVVYKLATNDTILYAGTDSGIFISSDRGTNWSGIFKNLLGWQTLALAVNGSNIIVSIEGLSHLINDIVDSCFISRDNGLNWRYLTFDVQIPGAGGSSLGAFAFSGSNIFASADDAVPIILLSTDSGQTWRSVGNGADNRIAAMTVSGPNLVIGCNFGAVDYAPLSSFGLSDAVAQLNERDEISLFPNPTPGPIIIRGASGAVVVTNVLGEVVLRGSSQTTTPYPLLEKEGESVTLDLSKLPAGTYFARIGTGNGMVVRTIIKE